jgi:hypothetical protein
VKLLLQRGADLEATNKLGQTALMYASRNGRIDIVRLLLKKGAKIYAKNRDQQTVLDLLGVPQDIKQLIKTFKSGAAQTTRQQAPPHTLQTPKTPHIPQTQTLQTPKTPHIPQTLQIPQTPKTPQTLQTPQIPQTPKTPHIPQTQTPKTLHMSELQKSRREAQTYILQKMRATQVLLTSPKNKKELTQMMSRYSQLVKEKQATIQSLLTLKKKADQQIDRLVLQDRAIPRRQQQRSLVVVPIKGEHKQSFSDLKTDVLKQLMKKNPKILVPELTSAIRKQLLKRKDHLGVGSRGDQITRALTALLGQARTGKLEQRRRDVLLLQGQKSPLLIQAPPDLEERDGSRQIQQGRTAHLPELQQVKQKKPFMSDNPLVRKDPPRLEKLPVERTPQEYMKMIRSRDGKIHSTVTELKKKLLQKRQKIPTPQASAQIPIPTSIQAPLLAPAPAPIPTSLQAPLQAQAPVQLPIPQSRQSAELPSWKISRLTIFNKFFDHIIGSIDQRSQFFSQINKDATGVRKAIVSAQTQQLADQKINDYKIKINNVLLKELMHKFAESFDSIVKRIDQNSKFYKQLYADFNKAKGAILLAQTEQDAYTKMSEYKTEISDKVRQKVKKNHPNTYWLPAITTWHDWTQDDQQRQQRQRQQQQRKRRQ